MMLYNVKKEELIAEAKERIIEELENGYCGYFCDIHDEVFNSDYEYIYASEAKEMLNEYDVFEAMEEIKTYEQDNFRIVKTDFSNACSVANMLWYIIGEEALNELMGANEEYSDFMTDLWNSRIEDEDRKTLINIFRENINN